MQSHVPLQTEHVQLHLQKLRVVDWIFNKFELNREQEVQAILPALVKPEQPYTALQQQANPSAHVAASSAAKYKGRAAVNIPAKVSFDALAAADSSRAGSVYHPPSSASTSAASSGNILAQQAPSRSPAKLPFAPLQPQSLPADHVSPGKASAAKAADVADPLADCYRDENNPPSPTGASSDPVEQGPWTEDGFPPGFEATGDANRDLDWVEAKEQTVKPDSASRCLDFGGGTSKTVYKFRVYP